MPSVAPVQVKKGVPAPPGGDTACEELKLANEKNRKDLKKELKAKGDDITQADEAALSKAQGGGMTFSSAQYNVGGQAGTMSGCSSGKANECLSACVNGGSGDVKTGLSSKIRNSKAQKHDKKKKDAGTLCDGYVHPGGGAGAHAEAKIMNELTEQLGPGGMSGGSILFHVDWHFNYNNKVRTSGMPCRHCFKMLCHAATECKIEIYLCDSSGKPQRLNEDDRCKKDEDKAIESLDKAMGEHPLKGRP